MSKPQQSQPQNGDANTIGVTTVPRRTEVRVAQVNRKVLYWTVAVAGVVIALSFVSIVIHGLVLQGRL